MRFMKGAIPEDAAFRPEDDCWKYIRDITPGWQQWISCLLIAPAAFLLGRSEITPAMCLLILSGILPLIPLHEFIHTLFMPRPRSKEAVIVGYETEKGYFYASYNGEDKKGNVIIMLGAPLFFISIMPVVILAMLGIHVHVLNVILVLHIAGCKDDICGILTILLQVPNGALLRSKGSNSYWRTA
jgi:hypothetical protein